MDSSLPLHLAIRPLSLNDADQVIELEKKCFSPQEAASSESILYRLTTCPELSSGLFVRTFGGKYADSTADAATKKTSHDNKSFLGFSKTADYVPDEKSSIVSEKLIGHIMSTKIPGKYIDEAATTVPASFVAANSASAQRSSPDSKVGHVESSSVIGLHSIAVDPQYRRKKMATLLLHDYKQKLANQQVGSEISLMAREELVGFYEEFGFEKKGVSKYLHGGHEWINMVAVLVSEEEKM